MAKVYLSIGSNIQRRMHIRRGLVMLEQHFGALTLSPIYETAACGFDGPNFYNLVAQFDSTHSVDEILGTLKAIEAANGRERSAKKFASRTLDIDILLYDDMICTQPCELPRGEILHYAFVLKPLADLAPNLIHPQLQQSYWQLWQNFDHSSQAMREVPPELFASFTG